MYRGDLLPEDRFEEWAEGPREALRERHLGLLVEYAEVLTGRGEHASGRRHEALAAFDRLREALAEEYAADPEPATRRLYRELLTAGDPPADVMAVGVAASAQGDAIRTLRPTPARALDGLRLEQTSFVGRRRKLAEIDRALSRTRPLTLTGSGGAGKTRLAYQAAGRLIDNYPDGAARLRRTRRPPGPLDVDFDRRAG